ncbi:trypsin alpha-like [Periplaneta americana]|uniref:trypsin alpha-like n=1 Tax=Periplaneta americana TaxID=6978 RepID=UPI0037E94F6E
MFREVIVCSFFIWCLETSSHHDKDNYIVGGDDGGDGADINDYPYVLSFEYYGSHMCGASIISLDWAVTSAHCVDGVSAHSVQLRAGSSIRESGGFVHMASQLLASPQYDYYTLDYDVAVVKVSSPFVYGAGVQPISLASTEPTVGSEGVVVGWNAQSPGGSIPTGLQAITVVIVDRDTCNTAVPGGITKSMFCAEENDVCVTDSGAGLAVNGQLVGIVSWNTGCGTLDSPGVYANVAFLRSFITDSTGVSR